MALRPGLTKFADVHQLELRRGQLSQRCDRKAAPVRIASLEGQEKGTIIVGERSAKRVDQVLERCLVIVIAERLEGHPIELGPKGLALILVRGIDEFGDRAAVADKKGDRAKANVLGQAFLIEQELDFEHLARMLAVENGADLSAEQLAV